MQQRTAPAAGYETDFALWVEDQAAALRDGRFGDVDAANVTDELEGLIRRDRRSIRRRLTLVAMHLLKLEFQPDKETRSWRNTIRVQAREIARILKDSPSLRRELPDFVAEAYADARKDASGETALPIGTFPQAPTPAFERALGVALAGNDDYSF
jgi:hypothetical protein